MAGFLAPQISDIGAARGGSAPPPDTSVGDALVGVSKIFDAFVTSSADALEKAVAATPEENALQKELSQEVGEAGEVEKPVEKTRSEKIAAYLPKAKTNGEEI